MRSFALLGSLLAILCFAGPASATDFRSVEGAYVLQPDQSVSNELWLMAATIDIRGQANDDLFLLSETAATTSTNAPASIQLAGTALGDVWAAGDSIESSGAIRRHARLLGYRYIQAGGTFERNLIAAGGSISVPESASIAGDALLAGRDVIVEGTIAGKTRLYAESATLAGRFGGDVTVIATAITVMPGTHIEGNLVYRDGENKEMILDPKVALQGKLIRLAPPAKAVQGWPSLGDVTLQLMLCMAAILVGIVFAGIFPSLTAMSVQRLTQSFWKCLFLGFVAFCLIPMTAFFLALTLVGIPLALLALCAYAILVYAGKLTAALYLGYRVVHRFAEPAAPRLFPLLALGALLIYAAALLPFPIDILVWFGFTLPGMGALAGAIMDRRTPVFMTFPPPPASGPPPLPNEPPPGR